MRENLKDKKRIVFKVGSSTLTHKETGALDLVKMEKFVRLTGIFLIAPSVSCSCSDCRYRSSC